MLMLGCAGFPEVPALLQDKAGGDEGVGVAYSLSYVVEEDQNGEVTGPAEQPVEVQVRR
jgi:hypothetical protein